MTDEELAAIYESWVVEVVINARVSERAYFLVVAYDGDDPEIGIFLGVGLDRERRDGDLSRKERRAKFGDWYNPANFENFDTPKFGVLIRQPTGQAAPRVEGWRDLYVELARRLSLRDWSSDLPVTDDFVVYATDIHLEDLEANFRATVPLPVRERLLAEGWISETMAHEAAAKLPVSSAASALAPLGLRALRSRRFTSAAVSRACKPSLGGSRREGRSNTARFIPSMRNHDDRDGCGLHSSRRMSDKGF